MPERPYDVEAQWIINLICNYTCDYCFSSAPEDPDLAGKVPPQACADFFRSTGKTWLFHLTGGEPFASRSFVELCTALSQDHFLAINSNLASQRVRAFVQSVSPKRVVSIHCGVHPEEREKRNGWPLLLDNLRILVEAGFPVIASCVMTPDAFALYERAGERLDSVGVPLIPKLVRGPYRGQHYPQSYSVAQREQFLRFSDLAAQRIGQSHLEPMRHDPTVNPLVDRYFLDGLRDFTGVSCSAGRDVVTISADGNIYACGETHHIGNLFQRRLKLFDQPKPCRSEWCHYVCVRYSAVDAAAAHSLPLLPVEKPLMAKVAALVHLAQRGAVNTLVRLSQP